MNKYKIEFTDGTNKYINAYDCAHDSNHNLFIFKCAKEKIFVPDRNVKYIVPIEQY